MTREIKFRFWSKILNQLVIPHDDIFVGALKDPEMVAMQYTGLRDKNGVEIYEGDIVKQTMSKHWWLYVVRVDERPDSQFGNTLFSWTIKDNFLEDEQDPDRYTYQERILEHPARNYIKSGKDCEVIGNIYENPELLTEEKL